MISIDFVNYRQQMKLYDYVEKLQTCIVFDKIIFGLNVRVCLLKRENTLKKFTKMSENYVRLLTQGCSGRAKDLCNFR